MDCDHVVFPRNALIDDQVKLNTLGVCCASLRLCGEEVDGRFEESFQAGNFQLIFTQPEPSNHTIGTYFQIYRVALCRSFMAPYEFPKLTYHENRDHLKEPIMVKVLSRPPASQQPIKSGVVSNFPRSHISASNRVRPGFEISFDVE